ncbi:MAG: tetratricopeptide repeat protein [Verrucomicrobiae bacterium]|nr:tetratricopeptide repeat protein [Verrucomicrobiae bacterium]
MIPALRIALLATVLAFRTAAAEDDPSARAQLDAANGIFARDFPELAFSEYEKYLQWFPTAKGVEEALYRSAECLRALGKTLEARARFEETARRFPSGVFAGRVEFRLGEMLNAEGKPAEALVRFAAAAARAKDEPTRLTARFSQAQLLLKLGRTAEAVAPLRELAQQEKANSYRGFALLELGRAVEAAGQVEEARLLYGKALDTDAAAKLRAEAGLRAAAIELRAARWGAAAAFLEKARRLLPAGDTLARANWTLLSCYWRLGQHETVARMAADPKLELPEDRRGDAALLSAHSLRSLGRTSEAAAAYGAFARGFPKHAEAVNAACERVICLAAANAAGWENEAAAFLRANPKAAGASRVLYLLGDRAFARGDFVAAAVAYAQVQPAALDPALAPEVAFRWGASLAKAGRHAEAVPRLEEFTRKHPSHPLVPQGLVLLGLSCQQLGRYDAALKAFQDLADRFPKAAEREDVLRRIALLEGALGRPAALREAYGRLAKEYPKTRFLDEAEYWTGASFFDEKKYAEALAPLEKARAMNPTAFGANATSRLVLARYLLHQRTPLAKELLALPDGVPLPAPEIWDWAARQSAAEGDHAAAVPLFAKLLAHPAGAPLRHAARRALAASLGAQGKWKPAAEHLETYVAEATDPDDSVAGRLDLARAKAALKDFEEARTLVEAIMTEQPEGRPNADARMILGEIFDAQGKPDEAAKQWLGVALLYADPQVTPDALARAAGAFERAGDTNQAARLRKELAARYPDAARAKP